MPRPVLALLRGVFLLSGCTGGSRNVQDLTSHDSGHHHHWAIVSYYSREAAMSRQQTEEMTSRVATYERLFGPDSDWVAGTRFLVEFYEEAAREQECLADLHLELGRGRSPHQLAR
ncbi:MAG: hypothetical protein ACREJN_20125 [Nitrospiraceae bacterium]